MFVTTQEMIADLRMLQLCAFCASPEALFTIYSSQISASCKQKKLRRSTIGPPTDTPRIPYEQEEADIVSMDCKVTA